MATNTNISHEERLAALPKDKKFINHTFWWLMFHITQLFTPERMLGTSMGLMMITVAPELYPDDPAKQQDLVQRHMVFFNTQQGFGAIIWGIVLGMEIENARSGNVPDDMIQTIKTALASPIAGIGDTLWQILFTPILLSIGIGMSANGSAIGAIFVLVVYFAVNVPLTYVLFTTGLRSGVDAAEFLVGSPLKNRLLTAVETLGIIIVGGTVGSMVNVKTALEFDINGVVVNLQQQVFDAIYPGILSAGAFMLVFYAMKKWKLSAMKMMGIMAVVAVIGYFTHILG